MFVADVEQWKAREVTAIYPQDDGLVSRDIDDQ